MRARPPAGAPPLPTECVDRSGQRHPVREYATADRARLETFYDEFEPKRAAQGLPPVGLDRVARWLDDVLVAGVHLLLLGDAGAVVGHAFLIGTHRDGEAEYAIFLHRDVRGRGLGTCLNRIGVAVARAAGWTRVWLSVEPHNRAAIRSYQKVGFRFLPATIFAAEAEMTLDLHPPGVAPAVP